VKDPTQPGSIVTRSEIRQMLPDDKTGKPMSRQRVSEVVEQDSFPAPVDVVHPGSEQPLWLREDVEAWKRDHRRGPGRPADANGAAPAEDEGVVPVEPLS
jgi:hypothetical protein